MFTTKRKKLLWLGVFITGALVAALGIATAGLSTSVEPALQAARTGSVVDAETGQALLGAHVVAQWWHSNTQRFPPIGHGTIGGFSNCLHREETQTDQDGRFALPSVRQLFTVERHIDLEHKDKYFWQLGAYLPGYYDSTERNPDRSPPRHPDVREQSDGSVNVAPIKLTKDSRSQEERIWYLVMGVPNFSCKWDTVEPVQFMRDIYNEAFNLACVSATSNKSLLIAQLRLEAARVMPALPRDIKQELEQLVAHAPPNWIVTPEEASHVCELLKKANEVAP